MAVIRAGTEDVAAQGGWLAMVVDESPDSELVVSTAMAEAQLRGVRVMAVGVWRTDTGAARYEVLDRRVAELNARYPHVRVFPVVTTAGVARFVAENRNEGIRMVVVGQADVGALADIIGPPGDRQAHCSVLVVR